MIPLETEIDVLRYLQDGWRFSDIADRCGVSRKTVMRLAILGRVRPRGPGQVAEPQGPTVEQAARAHLRRSGRIYNETSEFLGLELLPPHHRELVRLQACMPPERLESHRVERSPEAMAFIHWLAVDADAADEPDSWC